MNMSTGPSLHNGLNEIFDVHDMLIKRAIEEAEAIRDNLKTRMKDNSDMSNDSLCRMIFAAGYIRAVCDSIGEYESIAGYATVMEASAPHDTPNRDLARNILVRTTTKFIEKWSD